MTACVPTAQPERATDCGKGRRLRPRLCNQARRAREGVKVMSGLFRHFSKQGSDESFAAVSLTLRYWDTQRDNRPMPRRDEIDPRALGPALPHLFLAEPVAARLAKLRLAGQYLHELLGMDPRGMPLCAFFEAEARAEVGHAVAMVAEHGARVLLPVRAKGGFMTPALQGLLALMPLADNEGRPVRILGALHCKGMIGRPPRRLMLAGWPRTLTTNRAEPAPSVQLAQRRGCPALRVITGGRS